MTAIDRRDGERVDPIAPLTADELAAIEERLTPTDPAPYACNWCEGTGYNDPETSPYYASGHSEASDARALLTTVKARDERIATLEAIEKNVLSELDAENEDVITAAAYTFERLGKARGERDAIRALVAARPDESTEDAVRRAVEDRQRKTEADIISDLVVILHAARETISSRTTVYREIVSYLDALAHPEQLEQPMPPPTTPRPTPG